METTSNLLQQRRDKAQSLAEAGVRLFSNTFKAPQPIGELLPAQHGAEQGVATPGARVHEQLL